jgi:hypothetical protein
MMADNSKPCVFADLGPQTIDQGVLGNPSERNPEFAKYLERAAWIVHRNPFGDFVKVSLNPG